VSLATKEHTVLDSRLIGSLIHRNDLTGRVFRNFSIGFSGAASLMVLSVLLIPVLTKNLTIENYGRILIVGNFFQFLGLLIRVRVNDLIYRFLPVFEDRNEQKKIGALLRLALLISVTVGFVIFLLMAFGGRWVASIVYRDPSLHALLMIQMVSGVLMPLEEFSMGVLRIKDRFSSLVIPQIAGTALSVALIVVAIYVFDRTSLEAVISAIVVGQLVALVVPFATSLKLCWGEISFPIGWSWWNEFADHRETMRSTIIQTNLTNYLKVGARDGGIFLLGVLASPEQVALYGMAIKLTRPLTLLQDNLQQALNPEIVKLYGQGQFSRLYRLVKRTMLTTAWIGGALVLVGLVAAKPVILLMTTENFLGALPVFRVILIATYVMFISMPFFYLSLCMGELHRRNLAVSLRFLFIGIFCLTGLTAFSLAVAQLLGALVVRIFNDIHVMRRLRNLAATSISVKGES